MRITNQIISRRALESVQRSLAGIEEAHLKASTGLRIRKPADDPGAYVGVLSADQRLSGLDQYRRNIGGAEARLTAEEVVLDQLSDLISRARELGISQAGGTATTATRLVAKAELDQILATAISLGNTRYGNGYLFGGDFDADKPFAADGTTTASRPPVGTRHVETAAGQMVPVGHDGQTVFVDSGVLASIQRLSNALGADSDAEISASLTDLGSAFDHVQDLLGETGARVRSLEMASANVEALSLSLRSLRADLSEVDLEVAISELLSRQTAYQAALMTTSRMISTNLSDYLR